MSRRKAGEKGGTEKDGGIRTHLPAVEPELREFYISIHRPMPSVNEWHGAHWSVYHRHRNTWMQELQLTTHGVVTEAARTLPPKPRGRRAVTVTRVMAPGERRYDEENLRAGCKPILDALKRLGVIHGDSPAWLEGDAIQRGPCVEGEPAPSTFIHIRDLPHHGRRCRG